MSEPRHTKEELKYFRALPLDLKIRLTQDRIKAWVNMFGEDGVYVSFSGGKDSTVLLHLVRQLYPNVKAVFSNTGLEYPEIRQFAMSHDNVDVTYPDIKFVDVLTKYGYPLISKEVAEAIYYARRIGGGRTRRQSARTSKQKQNELNGIYQYKLREEQTDNTTRRIPPPTTGVVQLPTREAQTTSTQWIQVRGKRTELPRGNLQSRIASLCDKESVQQGKVSSDSKRSASKDISCLL